MPRLAIGDGFGGPAFDRMTLKVAHFQGLVWLGGGV